MVQTFCHRNAVWEATDIIYWNALCMGALQYTHAVGSLSEGQRTKGPKSPAQSVAFCPFPCFPGEQCADGLCCLSGHGSSIFSLLIPAAGFCYKPKVFQRVQHTIYSQMYPPSESCLRYFFYLLKPRRDVLATNMAKPHWFVISCFKGRVLGRGVIPR